MILGNFTKDRVKHWLIIQLGNKRNCAKYQRMFQAEAVNDLRVSVDDSCIEINRTNCQPETYQKQQYRYTGVTIEFQSVK